MPNEYGLEFPAYLTHKHAVDVSLIHVMRSVFVKGVRPAAFSDMLLEWHSRKYTLDYIRCEAALSLARTFNSNTPAAEFSAFSDRSGYDGSVPSGKYLGDVYKKYMREIKPHFDREIKKRGAERLHWDASYKEAKHLSQYHGLPVFKVHLLSAIRQLHRPQFHTCLPAHRPFRFTSSTMQALITATNEFGEIRLQFHVVTDGHDQMLAQIQAMLDTMEQYGQPPTKVFFTDNPKHDAKFMFAAIPSLRAMNVQLNASLPTPPGQVHLPISVRTLACTRLMSRHPPPNPSPRHII